MAKQERPPSNPRAERKADERRLLWLILFAFVVVGGGLIGMVYDLTAVLTALPCLLGGSGVIILLYGAVNGLERRFKQDV